MANEKCFCHLNGYAVKDAVARNEIEKLKKQETVDATARNEIEILKNKKCIDDIARAQIEELKKAGGGGGGGGGGTSLIGTQYATHIEADFENLSISNPLQIGKAYRIHITTNSGEDLTFITVYSGENTCFGCVYFEMGGGFAPKMATIIFYTNMSAYVYGFDGGTIATCNVYEL